MIFQIYLKRPFQWKGFFIFAFMLLFIGGPEILIILFFVVIFFGSKKIPDLAKGLARAIREVKDASNEIKKEIRDSASSIKDDFNVKK